MLVMKDCAVEPGDIIFVSSNSSNPLVRLKQAAQSWTTAGSKHGHREVISVFVCTGKNKYGVICHNFERKLTLSTDRFVNTLREQSIEELSIVLLNYCTKELSAAQIVKALAGNAPWMKRLARQTHGIDDSEELLKQILTVSKENKEKLIQLIVAFWRASGQADILSVVNSSLLVFKHNDSKIRQQFLEAYLAQIKVTEQFHAQGKSRISFWALLKSLFHGASQDKKDKEKLSPSDETYCSRQVMEVLNQINPDLVHRGRHVLPKSLEAGLREATKRAQSHTSTNQEQFDDFEAMVAAEEQLSPRFSLHILPVSGKELINNLLARVDKEINRIEHKRWANAADRQKASDLKMQLLLFRDPKLQTYPINLQVEVALKLTATLMPTLKRKTGIFGEWLPATSYTNIRAFLRTQGIFDGDIREAIETLKTKAPQRVEETPDQPLVEQPLDGAMNRKIYIFSDWSFSSWSTNKRELMLEHMTGLLSAGHSLYIWENDQLVKVDKVVLQNAIHGNDFDHLLAEQLKPTTRAALMHHAKLQSLDSTKLQFLDYKACQKLADNHESLEATLTAVSPLFSPKIDEYNLNKTKQAILDIEISNAEGDEAEQSMLKKLKERLAAQKSAQQKTYQSGIDTKAFVTQAHYRKPIFKPVALTMFTPSRKYYRDEVFTDLTINKAPSSPFQYFELQGMNATENMQGCKYAFHPYGLTKELIKKRKSQTQSILFAGEKNFSLTENWQSLPSLHPNETLLDIAIKGLKRNDFEIKYSTKNHLYYIRLTKPTAEPRDVTINLVLQMPKEYRTNPIFNTLAPNSEHQEIHRLLMKYLKFGKDNGQLRGSIDVAVHNGIEYLNELRRLGVASCRLRAIAFKEEMQRLYPDIPVSIIVNSDHCFIEMQLDGLWQSYCLGGYRDTPGLVESVKENTLESLSSDSRKHQFFTTKPKPQLDVPVDQNQGDLSPQVAYLGLS
jgi:hypothetical protein